MPDLNSAAGRRFLSLEAAFDPALAEVGHEPPEDEDRGEAARGEDPVPLYGVRRGLAAVVGDEPDERRPADAAGGVPEQESRPVHSPEPRDPRCGVAEHRDEAAEEDRLAPVLPHQLLGTREDPLRVLLQPAPALEERAAPPAADDPVAEVVPDDRGRRRDGDDGGDVVVAL